MKLPINLTVAHPSPMTTLDMRPDDAWPWLPMGRVMRIGALSKTQIEIDLVLTRGHVLTDAVGERFRCLVTLSDRATKFEYDTRLLGWRIRFDDDLALLILKLRVLGKPVITWGDTL